MTIPPAEPTPTPAVTSLVGQLVSGRYRIEKLIGSGGMGAVYLAEHTLMRKRVALKLLHAEMSADEDVLARFRREAEAAAHVEHPNVAAATDFGQTEDGAFFLVLEYVEGTSLRDVLADGKMAPERALHVARQISFALERAHGAGIVHRDLKPENVMLVRKGDDPDFVKVLDFGIAKVEPHPTRDATQPLTRLGTILGTPEYMAPEQALGEPVGPGSDLYAVGVMLYEMLTGLHPFDATDRMAVLSMHIVAPVPPMSDRSPTTFVPPKVEALVRQLLEKDVALRPLSARALASAIDVAAAESGLVLAHATATRSYPGDSAPEVGRPSSHSLVDPRPSVSRDWQANDALAKTAYGLDTGPTALPLAPRAGTSARRAVVRSLQTLPKSVLVALFTLAPLVVVVAIVLALRASKSIVALGSDASVASGAEAARSPRASAESLRVAAAGGVPALEVLARDFPEDPAVQEQLARSLADAGRSADMLDALRTRLRLDKSPIGDELVDAVVRAASVQATADEAFALLEGPLGARGFDELVELSTSKAAPPTTQKRAAKSIARPEVRANASPAAAVAIELKAARSCGDRHAVLERARDDGDARILPALKALRNARGCGFMRTRDCWPCLRKDDALDEAIKSVEGRAASKTAP